MSATPHGFDSERLLTFQVPLPGARYAEEEERTAFAAMFSERLSSLPEVYSTAITSDLPTRLDNRDGLAIQDAPWPAGTQTPFILAATVSDDYFRTLGIPLRAGRTFDATDRPDSPPVVIIIESLARRYWPAGDALGARVRLGPDHDGPWSEVVGIVGDVRNDPAQRDAEPMVYYAFSQAPWPSRYVVRTAGEPYAAVASVRRVLAEIDAALPLEDAKAMETVLGEGLAPRRLPATLLAGFGLLALLLAAVGVYAMFANMAAAREREFGVRMALGSSPAQVAALVLRQGAVWIAAGIASGLFGVWAVTRVLRNLLFGIDAFDPVAIGAALISLVLCATIALAAPVLRAARVDPATIMR